MVEAQQQVGSGGGQTRLRDGVDHKKNASRKEGKGIERSKLREGPEPRLEKSREVSLVHDIRMEEMICIDYFLGT